MVLTSAALKKLMLEWISFALVGIIWGGSFVAIKEIVDFIPPFQGAFIRVFIALVCLLIILKIQKKKFSVASELRWPVWIAGLFSSGIPLSFLFIGETRVSAAVGGLINGTVPLWTLLLGALFFPSLEKLNRYKVVGLVVGMCGILFLYLPRLSGGTQNIEFVGVLYITAMAISYGIGTLQNKRLFQHKMAPDVLTMVAQQSVSSLVYLGILSLAIDGLPTKWGFEKMSVALSLLYTGVLSSALAFVMFYQLIKKWGALTASSVTYVIPVSTLILNYLIFKTGPESTEYAAMVFIIAGVAISRRVPKTLY